MSPSFLRRLKERKLGQWGLAYLGAAWLLLQLLSMVAQPFAWPDLAMRLATVLLALGLPVVLVLAWYHGENGSQRVSSIELLMLAGILAIAGAAVAFVIRPVAEGSAPGGRGATAPPPAGAHSLAVLPLSDLSPDSADRYLGDGVSEEILGGLTRLPGLTVVGRASSFRFRGPDVDALQVGRELGVGALLAGTIQRAGSAVRIHVELVDTRTGVQLWTERYDRQMGNLFALEDDIARAITDALRVQLDGGTVVRRGTPNADAHDLVLRANALSRAADEQSIDRAVALYGQAIAMDSGYAAAWAGLSQAYGQLADAYRSPVEMATLADRAATRAVALDDSCALAHTMLGDARYDWEWRYADARREYRRALALDPGVGEAHLRYATLLLFVDEDFDSAERELATAATLDPFNPDVARWQEFVAIARRDTTAALRLARHVTELAGGPVYYSTPPLALANAMAGRWSDCVRSFDPVPASRLAGRSTLAMCQARIGDTASARRVLDELVAQPYMDQVNVAQVQLAMGDRDAALASLARAVQDRSANVTGIRTMPWLAELWGDPRFAAIIARAGLPPHGPPSEHAGAAP